MIKKIIYWFVIVFASLFFCYSVYPSQENYQPKTSIVEYADLSEGLFEFANNEREIKLEWNECLAEKAVERAKDMSERNYFSHTDPLTGETLAWNLINSCIDYRYAGENLAMDFNDASIAHRALMNSELHRKNILNINFRQMGVGCFRNICVELFAGLF